MWSDPNDEICILVNPMIRETVENTHKIVAMIIPFMASHPDLNLVVARVARGLEEHFRMKLVEEGIRGSLEVPSAACQSALRQCRYGKVTHIVNEDIDRSFHPSNKDARIVIFLSFFHPTREVPSECFLTPRNGGRLADRGEGRARTVLPRA